MPYIYCCLQDLAEDVRRFGANAKERLPGSLPDPEGLAMIQAQMVRRNPEVLDHVLRAVGAPELPALPAKVHDQTLQQTCNVMLRTDVSCNLTHRCCRQVCQPVLRLHAVHI